MNPVQLVSDFIDRINAHNVQGLCALMEEDHVFIDGLGNSMTGREAMRQAWQGYFAMVPDYWIKVERILQQETIVALFGRAGGTLPEKGRLEAANRWEVPAHGRPLPVRKVWQPGRFSPTTNLSGRSWQGWRKMPEAQKSDQLPWFGRALPNESSETLGN